jgi:hypothetical protein
LRRPVISNRMSRMSRSYSTQDRSRQVCLIDSG